MPDVLGQPPTLGKHGGKRIKGTRIADVTLRQRGNSRAYIVARLARDGYSYWLDEIRNRRISAFAAAVDLGWKRRPQTSHSTVARRRGIDPAALIG